MPYRLLIALLMVALPAWGRIIHVPQRYNNLQWALNVSLPGDTILVARGIYYGRFTSPTHSLTLCSNYPFTGDSADIAETILDGEYLGTILDIVCVDSSFTLCGMTLQHGMGQETGAGAYCFRGGAVQSSSSVDLEIRDVVFRENRALRDAPVLYFGENCTSASFNGNLSLRNIVCTDWALDEPPTYVTYAMKLICTGSRVIIDGVRFDGGSSPVGPMQLSAFRMDSVYVNDLQALNGENGFLSLHSSVVRTHGQVFSNIRMAADPGVSGCLFNLYANHYDVDSSVAIVRNIELSGLTTSLGLRVGSARTRIELDGLLIHGCRSTTTGSFASITSDVSCMMRDVELYDNSQVGTANAFCSVREFDCAGLSIHDCRATGNSYGFFHATSVLGSRVSDIQLYGNVSGDSLSNSTCRLLNLSGYDIDGAWIHDNRAIIPAAQGYGGRALQGAMCNASGDVLSVSNIRCENNRVDDLDPGDNPDLLLYSNHGRDFSASGSTSLTARNIVVLNSRQPNHNPERIVDSELVPHGLGSSLSLSGALHLFADSIWVEDVDDCGLELYGDSIRVTNAVFRSVERAAVQVKYSPAHVIHRDFHFRNLLVQDLVAVDNLLPANQRHLSRQAVIHVEPSQDHFEWAPRLRIENSTVTGSRGLRHLIHGITEMTLDMNNNLFWDNTVDVPAECEGTLTQTWLYNLVPPGFPEGDNYVGAGPDFDPERGIPVLNETSVCIDGGNPAPVFNDAVDPEYPGIALWPGQGTVRNDIGYTGGPHAGDLEYVVPVESRPDEPPMRPSGFLLHPARPNPFNPSTLLSYTLGAPAEVELSVFTLQGRRVRSLVSGWQAAGLHEIVLESAGMASGLYLVALRGNGQYRTGKVLLLK
ncbi:MAG: T9SS type A sorting domain-containing protein [Calditrichaeota bacterium]|nr:T9SS type A sorting domain-containing protein [Calditrichota bacterium]